MGSASARCTFAMSLAPTRLSDQPLPAGWLRPLAQLPGVSSLSSARAGGHSVAPYATSNLGLHVGDDPLAVQRNRAEFERRLGMSCVWLDQVHGNRVLTVDAQTLRAQPADGAITAERGVGCVVMVADCLPVLMAAPEGRAVGALHAGWRGLSGAGEMAGQGILETGVPALCELAGCEPADITVWLGPCIGPTAFEVGAPVLEAFGVGQQEPHPAFRLLNGGEAPKWRADLHALAHARLGRLGVRHIHAQGDCTVSDPARFFSFRRDGVTGRQAAAIGRQ